MFGDPGGFQALIDKFTDMTIAYFRYQAQHGIQAIQLFDTWGGTLSAYDFNRYLFPSVKTHYGRYRRSRDSTHSFR